MAFWNRITALVTGGAVATAVADAMKPEFEVLMQTAWANEPHRVLDPGTAAELRARETVDDAAGINLDGVNLPDDAARRGTGSVRFDLLTELARTNPDVARLYALRRRGIGTDNKEGISAAEFRRYMRRHGYTAASITQQEQLLQERLDLAQLAAAIHRGLIPDPGLLKGEQPEAPFNVEPYPVYPIDAVAEAESHGFNRDRLGVAVGLQGLPMGPHEAAQAVFRGILTWGDYIRAFNESNNRNEWARAVFEQSKQIPTARDFFENALRGYHELPWAQEQAKRHGMSEADSLVIYQNQGRPMNIRQITQALSRGGKFNPEPGELTDPYRASIVEGNVKPAYYDLALSLKYSPPSPFAIRQLATSGVWNETKTAKRLKDIGWLPADADEVAKAWTAPAAAKADTHEGKAQTQLWNALHSAYMAGDATDAFVTEKLPHAGVAAATVPKVLTTWHHEREVVRQRITPAQLKKAWVGTKTNPLTGAPWTRDEVLTELLSRGWNSQDANTFLEL